MKSKVIMIASSKGGVGKSTVALGVARSLAHRGRTVLLCDLDFGNACLDMLLAAEDRVIYTVADAAEGKCSPESPVLDIPGCDGLYLLPAPAGGAVSVGEGEGNVPASEIGRVVLEAAQSCKADFVVLDTGAGVNAACLEAAKLADTVLLAASHSPVSLRAAESTAARLRLEGAENIRLIINAFEAESTLRRKSARNSLFEIIDSSGTPLMGVVPYDYSLLLGHEGSRGGKKGLSAPAFENIAARLDGENVPLFLGIGKIRKKRKKLYQ